MFSCDEHLAGTNPTQGSELCTVVETMFSLSQSLSILGDPTLGDRLERIAYNALPGTLTDDMWAHQYNQQSNQIECGHIHPWLSDGPESNLFGLAPNFGCCTANYHQGWPKLTSSLWMASSDGGLAAAVYAPCEVSTTLNGNPIHLAVSTDYPFRSQIRIQVHSDASAHFSIHLRIPAWATGATLKVNGKPEPNPTAVHIRQDQPHLEARRPYRPDSSHGPGSHPLVQQLHRALPRPHRLLLPHRHPLGEVS